ncbi:MAG: GxxExxY protein, partial [bacterium]
MVKENRNYSPQRRRGTEKKGFKLDCGYRIDLLVEEKVIVELKAVEQLL